MPTKTEDRHSIDFIRECFQYRDGALYWKERPAHHFKRPNDHATFITRSAGKPAGRDDSRGYLNVKLRVGGKAVCISVHRIVWALHHGKWPDHTIDHIDRNPRNNLIENLRDVTMSVNLLNRGNPNSTGIPGVNRNHGKFAAQIRIGDKYVHLGTFETTDDGLEARLLAESAAMSAVNKPTLARLLPLQVREG